MTNPSTFRRFGFSSLVLAGVCGLFVAPLSSSCSLIVDADASQCDKDADCAQFPSSVCLEHTCSGGGSCTTTAECSKQFGDGFVCKQFGTRACVKLANDLCPIVDGPYNDENAIFIGSVFPVSGSETDKTGISSQNAARLALKEINELNGIPGADGNFRKLVLVACDDTADKDTSIHAGQHLVNDLGIQAVIGASYSGLTLGLFTATKPGGALLISPSATSTSITSQDDADPSCAAACGDDKACLKECPGLLWRTSPSDIYQSAAIIKYFPDLEAQVRGELSLPSETPIKVAIAYKGDTYGKGLADAVVSGPSGDDTDGLRFNGMSALSQSGGNFLELDYGNEDDPGADSLKYDIVNPQILAFHPHIMLILGTEEGISKVFSVVQGGLKSTGTHFLFSDGGAQRSLSQLVANDSTVRSRILGTIPGTNGANFQSFKINFTGQYSDAGDGSPFVFGAAGAYDSTYLLAYSAAAAGSKPLTGAEYARGFSHLVPPATLIKAGTSKFNDAIQNLKSGSSIDYDGASGPLNFDLALGEAPSDIQFWCVPSVTSQDGVDPINSGLFYDATNDAQLGMISGPTCGF